MLQYSLVLIFQLINEVTIMFRTRTSPRIVILHRLFYTYFNVFILYLTLRLCGVGRN